MNHQAAPTSGIPLAGSPAQNNDTGLVNSRRKPTSLTLAKDNQALTSEPLMSPRAHLLDRIRTPRRFIPQSIRETDSANGLDEADELGPCRSLSPKSVLHQDVTPDRDAPPARRFSSSAAAAGTFYQQEQKQHQLSMLEQQLREQNSILMQQRLLLQQMQAQQHGHQRAYSQGHMQQYIATPPFSPATLSNSYKGKVSGTQIPSNLVYDPVSGQCFAYTTPDAQARHSFTSPAATKHNLAYPNTPESMPRPHSARVPTPPKEGQPIRQPKGPPQLEVLTGTNSSFNFASRTRQRAAKILGAGLLRRQNSPASELFPGSPSSLGSRGMASIEEAFPALSVSH